MFSLKKKFIESSRPPVNFFNDTLRTMRDQLSAIKTISDVSKNPQDREIYKICKKHYKITINLTKKSAYENYLKNAACKPKAAWILINYERNCSSKKANNCNITPEEFQNYFSSIVSNILKELPATEHRAAEHLRLVPRAQNSFVLLPTDRFEVEEAILSLKQSKCQDIYQINSQIVKECKDILIDPLVHITNLCFSKGIFPAAFKLTKLIPIYKR